MTTSGAMSDFLMCSLNPFDHAGTLTGVPDRFDGTSVVYEARTLATTIGVAGKDTVILCLPSIGANLAVAAGVTADLKLNAMSALFTLYDPLIDVGDASSAFDSYRTLSLGLRVTPVGKAMSRGGFAMASLYRLVLDGPIEGLWGKEGAKAANRAWVLNNLDFSQAAMLSSADSALFPTTHPFTCVSKHASGDSWEFADLEDQFMPVVKYPAPTADGKLVDLSPLFDGGPLMTGFDRCAFAIAVVLKAQTTEMSYLVETVHCVEATVAITSNISRTLARPSPMSRPAELDKLSVIQRQLPVGYSEASSRSWLDHIADAAKGIDWAGLVSGAANLAIDALPGGNLGRRALAALPWP